MDILLQGQRPQEPVSMSAIIKFVWIALLWETWLYGADSSFFKYRPLIKRFHFIAYSIAIPTKQQPPRL